ncbi:DUF1905 domain-containing protein [Nocardia flavorosea]|uniref:DUF1905 domain-containing protein n=1 Tax=Nocardia flavorosea TaxID=53429 RepID=UPI003CC7CF9A
MLTFDTVIELAGKTATGFRVPAPVVEELGSGKKPKVAVRIGGHTYRSTVAVYGGEYMLPLSAENRNAAGVSAGETVTVDVELDTSERTVTVPGDLAAALAGASGAREVPSSGCWAGFGDTARGVGLFRCALLQQTTRARNRGRIGQTARNPGSPGGENRRRAVGLIRPLRPGGGPGPAGLHPGSAVRDQAAEQRE